MIPAPPKNLTLKLDGRNITTQQQSIVHWLQQFYPQPENNRIKESNVKRTRAAPWGKPRSWGCVPAHGGLWGCRPIAPSHPEDPPSALWDWRHPQTPPSESPHELESEWRIKRRKIKAMCFCAALQCALRGIVLCVNFCFSLLLYGSSHLFYDVYIQTISMSLAVINRDFCKSNFHKRFNGFTHE